MQEPAASSAHIQPSTNEDAVGAHARTLRAVIESIPTHHRKEVFAKVADLLPKYNKEPRRGGEILNNVYLLYKQEPSPKGAAEVVEALQKKGGVKIKDTKPVYNAINYLRRARVLRKVGYGMYQLEDGTYVDIP